MPHDSKKTRRIHTLSGAELKDLGYRKENCVSRLTGLAIETAKKVVMLSMIFLTIESPVPSQTVVLT